MQTSCGSPCYAAPELVISEGLYVGSAVDIWSCGVILYAMLAGYLPFDDDPANPDGDNINLLYKYIVSTPLSFPEYISMEARDLLGTMLVPDPTRRTTLDSVMRHPWLSAYHGSRTDGRPSAFGKTVEELEKSAMDQHNLKRQAYQRQMRAVATTATAAISPSRTQSHRAEASAPASSSRSRSTQPEYLYESSVDQSTSLPSTANITATPTHHGTNKKTYGSPAALGLAEDDPFAGPGGSRTNNAAASNSDPRVPSSALSSTAQSQGHRPSSSTGGGSFRHTIQVEYDDPSKTSKRDEKRRERSGSQSQSIAHHQQQHNGTAIVSAPGPATPSKERKPSQSGIKPLPPSPPTTVTQSSRRGPIQQTPKITSSPPAKDARPAEPNHIHIPEVNLVSATPRRSAPPEQQDKDKDSGSQNSVSSTKGGHKRGKLSLDKIGLGKIFGSGSAAPPVATSVNGSGTNSSRNGSIITPVPSDGQVSASSVLSGGDKEEPEKKSRRNTLTVMVEPFSRSIRGKKAKMASSLLSSQPNTASLPGTNSTTPAVSDASFSPAQDTAGMQASTNKAKKVMQWFRTKSKGHDSVGFPTEDGVTPKGSKYRKGFSSSSSTLSHVMPSTALGLAESAMSPQVIVTSPNSARHAPPTHFHVGHPQRSASASTETSIATPSFVTRFRNSITASTATPLRSEKTRPHDQLRIHHGAVDRAAITTRPPPEVMALVKKVLGGMGIEVQLESEYKYRCIRAKKKKGTMAPSVISPATPGGNVSPSTRNGSGLAAVSMVGSAASNGVNSVSPVPLSLLF